MSEIKLVVIPLGLLRANIESGSYHRTKLALHKYQRVNRLSWQDTLRTYHQLLSEITKHEYNQVDASLMWLRDWKKRQEDQRD